MGRLLSLLLLGIAAVSPRAGWCGNTVGNGHVTMQADPCFVNYYSVGVVPYAVTLVNQGSTPVEGELTARGAYDFGDRGTYRRTVTVPGGGAPTRFIVYPNIMYGGVTVAFGGRSGDLTMTLPYGSEVSGNVVVSMITTRVGALTPVGSTLGAQVAALDYRPDYVRPENAPDRPVGYHGTQTLVVSGDVASTLTPTQVTAIRRWVISGGSLVVLGATHDVRSVTDLSPDFAEMLPVTLPNFLQQSIKNTIDQVAVNSVTDAITSNTAYSFPGTSVRVLYGTPTADASTFGDWDSKRAWLARRSLGAGTVLYCGVDLTDHFFRSQAHYYNRLWSGLVALAAPYASARTLHVEPQNAPWMVATSGADTVNYQGNWHAGQPSEDPFHLALPQLREVLYLFLTYFVLAIPVTFVVLKRTRRMNLAWVTGPVLAVIFAGAFCLFSIRLYSASMARRTSGVLVAAGGDHEAQFAGYTEMFLPHGGSYDVTVPHADTLSLVDAVPDYSGGANARSGDMQTYDDGAAVVAPDLSVGNLSFRRVFHSQTVDFGGGISARLRRVSGEAGATARIVGTITNHTGLTIHSVTIKQTGPNADVVYWTVSIPELKPGATEIDQTALAYGGVENGERSPELVGYVSGENFGPQLGKSVGGDSSVKLIVSLPLMTDGKN